MKQGFVLSFVIGYLSHNLEDILELFTFGGDKQYSSAAAVELEGSNQSTWSMLCLVDWGWNLVRPPLSHEID